MEDEVRRGKKRLELSQEELEKHFHVSQQEAAKRLGVSVSTLKRRFYEIFNNMRWPYHHAVHGPNSKAIHDDYNVEDEFTPVIPKATRISPPHEPIAALENYPAFLRNQHSSIQAVCSHAAVLGLHSSVSKIPIDMILNETNAPEKNLSRAELEHLHRAMFDSVRRRYQPYPITRPVHTASWN